MVTHPPRKTRFRLLVRLYRTGLVTRRVPSERFQASNYPPSRAFLARGQTEFQVNLKLGLTPSAAKWRRCVAASIAVDPSAILTGSRTRPSDWGWNVRFGPVEGRRNNHSLVTVTCIIWILQIWWLSSSSTALPFHQASPSKDALHRTFTIQPASTRAQHARMRQQPRLRTSAIRHLCVNHNSRTLLAPRDNQPPVARLHRRFRRLPSLRP